MNLYSFSLMFYGVSYLLFSLFVWLKRQDHAALIYCIFSTLAALWGIGFAIMVSEGISDSTALLALRIADGIAIFIPVTWYHFTVIYTGVYDKKINLVKLFYVLAAILGGFAFTPYFIPTTKPILNFEHFTEPGPAFHFFTVMFFVIVSLAFIEMINKIKRSKGAERGQVTGFAFAVFISFMGGALSFAPVYDIALPQYGIFFMPLYPFIMAYFMIRKNLFNEVEIAKAVHKDKLAALGVISSSINHEIKNPLYIIQGATNGFLEKIRERDGEIKPEDSIQAFEIITKIAEQSNRAMDIMRTMKLFSATDINHKPDIKRVSVCAVVDSVLPLIEQEFRLENIEINNLLRDKDVSVNADERHLQQVFFNLILNACQTMKKNGRVKIAAEQMNGVTLILIQDTGPGMTKAQCISIFEPFYTTMEEGTGLGLYITKQLVEKNGGKISVKSEQGKGTTFTLEFKL